MKVLCPSFFPATKREKYDWHLDSDSCVYVLRASASWAKSSRFLVSRNPVDRFVSEMLSPQMRPEKKRRMPFSICLFVCSYVPKRPTYGIYISAYTCKHALWE